MTTEDNKIGIAVVIGGLRFPEDTPRDIVADALADAGFDDESECVREGDPIHEQFTVKREWVKYRVTASVDHGGTLVSADDLVQAKWHDDIEGAEEECEEIASYRADDDNLELSIYHHTIQAGYEPTESDWNNTYSWEVVECKTARQWMGY